MRGWMNEPRIPRTTGPGAKEHACAGDPPADFGDVVVLSDGSLGVVCAPDPGARQVTCLELDELGNLSRCGDQPEIVIAGWDAVQRVVGW